MNVTKIRTQIPLGKGTCTHQRTVWFNLTADIVIHSDDDTDCDGDLVVAGKTGWR